MLLVVPCVTSGARGQSGAVGSAGCPHQTVFGAAVGAVLLAADDVELLVAVRSASSKRSG